MISERGCGVEFGRTLHCDWSISCARKIEGTWAQIDPRPFHLKLGKLQDNN